MKTKAKKGCWAALLALSACSSVQEYPRCYLFRTPTEVEVQQVNSDTEALFSNVFSVEEYWTGRDSVFVRATALEHANIRAVWPTSACINLRREPPFSAEIIDKWIIARCQEFLDEYIESDQQDEGGEDSPTEIAARYDEFACH